MKIEFRLLLAATLIVAFTASSCRKKKKEDPKPDYSNGIVDGTYTIDEDEIDETVNIRGGNLIIVGETNVTGVIHLGEEGGSLEIHDSVQVHQINMKGGEIVLTGSPTIITDFIHTTGTVYIGNCHSKLEDTVTVKGNYIIDDTLYVMGGVLVIEHDFNQNAGFINVEDGAKIIVRNHFNPQVTVYGMRNIECGVLNDNKGVIHQEPLFVDKCSRD